MASYQLAHCADNARVEFRGDSGGTEGEEGGGEIADTLNLLKETMADVESRERVAGINAIRVDERSGALFIQNNFPNRNAKRIDRRIKRANETISGAPTQRINTVQSALC